jgi:hypothetical protein
LADEAFKLFVGADLLFDLAELHELLRELRRIHRRERVLVL